MLAVENGEARILEARGYAVHEARNGREGRGAR